MSSTTKKKDTIKGRTMQSVTISDNRRHGFFIVDNEIVDSYHLPPHAGWLYMILLRYANHATKIAFPSHATLAKVGRMTEPTVRKYLKVLEDLHLIAIEPQYDPDTKVHSNTHYRILPVVKEIDQVVNDVDQGDKTDLPGVVNDVSSNNTKPEQDETNKIKESAPIGAAAGENEEALPDLDSKQPHIAIIDAYWAGLPGGKPVRQTYGRLGKVAVAMRDDGITPAQVTQFLRAVYDRQTEIFDYKRWHNRPIPLEEVADLIKPWIERTRPIHLGVVPVPDWIAKIEAERDIPDLDFPGVTVT